jgi:hypothetical protein
MRLAMWTEATLELNDGLVSAVRPTLGAGLTRFDYMARGKRVPLFRSEPEHGPRRAFDLASQVLVPWSKSIQLWFESFQNWQSEFMSTAVLVLLSIFLRHKGSPESKPAGASNSATGA